MNYYYSAYNQYIYCPNGRDSLLVISDFMPHMHKWVKLSLDNGNVMTVFLVQILGSKNIKILTFPSLSIQVIDVRKILEVSEIDPTQC